MKLLCIDGNSIVNRAFYGVRLLTTKNGLYTNGVFGFMAILNKLLSMTSPDGVVVAFDVHAPTFRHKNFAEYKAGRKGMPDELRVQMPILKKLLGLFGYTCLELEGYEADDILGTLARICEDSGNTCVIATGDRDSFQLVSDKTTVLLPSTKGGHTEVVTYTPEVIFEKYGVTPPQMIDIKALQGDSSDNIPGVPGIGEKTAGDLVQRFGSVDNIYENLDTLDIKESLKLKLQNGKDLAFLSKELGTIFRSVPIESDVSFYKTGKRQDAELAELLVELEFFKMLESLGLDTNAVKPKEDDKQKVYSVQSVTPSEVLAAAAESGVCDIFFEADNGSLFVSSNGKAGTVTIDMAMALLCDFGIKKRVYDGKPLYKELMDWSIEMENVTFDTSLAAYLINPSSSDYELGRLAAEYKANVQDCDGLGDRAYLGAVNDILESQIKSLGQDKLLKEIELPLSYVLARMEKVGFLVDKEGIARYGTELQARIEELQSKIWIDVGYEFNLNSPKQLGVALFETLGLPCRKKTKSGYSTNADVLESLRELHPVVDNLLEYRTLSKLKSTYCDGLLSTVCEDGRIRSTLNQTETRTGRISSSEPNLQNIPVRRKEGRELRRFFKARDGFVLCDADYSQIELRVLAHIANDENMINAFLNDIDIHTLTASQVFNMPQDMVTPLMRSRAKAVNFGIVYGIGAFSLANDIGVTTKEAADYIKSYLLTYKKVDEYMQRVVEKAKEDGFASTVFGRRRLLPELKNSNAILRAFGERVARNMPIQGTAADIIKIAMIKVENRLKREMPEARLIMQVHDELIVEAPADRALEASQILKEEMEGAADLLVPLTVDVNCGATWYDAKG